MGEIVLRITVPDGWGEEMKKALERRLVIDVARELQRECYAKTNFVIILEHF
ncbi:MAG: hypothetical protein J7K48_08845 [Thermococcus sp.]|nr:hypothetical protein [Thermococcus sp.]